MAVTIVDIEKKPSVLPETTDELIRLRKEAVEGRAASGIEQKWEYAENAYNGSDAKSSSQEVYKPSGLNSAFISNTRKGWKRSTAFLNITRPYVDAAASRVVDMLFPTDDRNWELRPTPKLDTQDELKEMDDLPDEHKAKVLEVIQVKMEQAVSSVIEAQQQIDDWLKESEFNVNGRETIHNAARVGAGVLKGPVPMKIKGRIQPGSKVVRVQNCYPDPTCGTDIHNGDYFWEREEISARLLRDKRSLESAGWRPAEITACLEEGPKAYNGAVLMQNGKPRRMYELWHFQGDIAKDALEECGCTVADDAGEKVWANLTLCNDYIIRASVAPLENRFTYDIVRWQKRDGSWDGIGVGEQLETPQRGLNAGIRNLFDNAALSSLPQIIWLDGVLTPVNGRFEIEPGKEWKVADADMAINDVKNALMTIEIPSRQDELMEIIALMRDVAQETTGMPMIMQGHGTTGQVGSDQMQINAGSTVLRRLAKEFDDRLTVPHIHAYYDWIKQFNVIDVAEATVDARGSSVLVERDIQAQALIQMVQLSKDPSYGMDPKLVAAEWMRSQKFDPNKVKLSPEREKELNALLSQPDEKAQAAVESANIRAQALTHQAQLEADSDRIKSEIVAENAERDREHDKTMLTLKYKLELIQYAMQKNVDIATAIEQIGDVNVPIK